jgi:MerC mercury resistance protein
VTTPISKDVPTAESAPRRGRPTCLQTILAVPAAVLPLLPSFSCPICVAAYAGVLSSLGLGFLLTDRVQRPLIVAFLVISVSGVGWATKRHKRVGPIVLVVLGSTAIVAGRVVWSVTPMRYGGVVCLVAGSIWNLALRRPGRKADPLSKTAGQNR